METALIQEPFDMADIQITQLDPKTGIVSLGLTNAPKTLSGILLLAQVVALSYMRNPGKDVIDPTEGSGLRGDIGQYNFDPNDPSTVRLLCISRTKIVQAEVLARQQGTTINPVERLASLRVQTVAFDSTTYDTLLQVQITNEAGDTTTVVV
jgi:hypothetical protein